MNTVRHICHELTIRPFLMSFQMALFKGNSGQQLSLRLSSLLHAGKTCHQQLRMLHLRQNDLSEIMAGLDLDADPRGSKLEYRQIFHQGPPADLGHERLMSKVRLFSLFDTFLNYRTGL